MNLTRRQWAIFEWEGLMLYPVSEERKRLGAEFGKVAMRELSALSEYDLTLALIREDIKYGAYFGRAYGEWMEETGYKFEFRSVVWYRKQTIAIDEIAVLGYLLYAAGKPQPMPEVMEIARQDILMRRATEECMFKTAIPLRKAYEAMSAIREKALKIFGPDLEEIHRQIGERIKNRRRSL